MEASKSCPFGSTLSSVSGPACGSLAVSDSVFGCVWVNYTEAKTIFLFKEVAHSGRDFFLGKQRKKKRRKTLKKKKRNLTGFRTLFWTARRSNQSILKEIKIKPEYSLEGLMLKLKLKYFGHLMRGAHSLERTLMLGKLEARRRRGRQRRRWLDAIIHSMGMSLSKLGVVVEDRQAWRAAAHGVAE